MDAEDWQWRGWFHLYVHRRQLGRRRYRLVASAVSVNRPIQGRHDQHLLLDLDRGRGIGFRQRQPPNADCRFDARRLQARNRSATDEHANGTAISPAVTVYVQDQFGNTFSSSPMVTLTLSSGSFAGGGNTVSLAASGGVATFNNLVINAVGAYTLTASDGTLLGTVSSQFNVVAATQVRFTEKHELDRGRRREFRECHRRRRPGQPRYGRQFHGHAVLNGGTFAGGNTTATAQAVNGVATFNSLVINTAGTRTLSASDGGLTGDTSNSFSMTAASPATLAFTQQPTGSVAGVPLNTIAVAVQDQFGNTILNDGSTVTLTLSSGVFSTGVNTATANASSGIATFNSLTINQNGTLR